MSKSSSKVFCFFTVIGHQIEQIPITAQQKIRIAIDRQIQIRFVVGIAKKAKRPGTLWMLVETTRIALMNDSMEASDSFGINVRTDGRERTS